MLVDYNYEKDRVTTFTKWESQHAKPEDLARCGFVYLGRSDLVQCRFCGIRISQWERGDSVYAEHKKHSPNCPLLLYKPTKNVPVNEEEFRFMVPKLTHDTAGIHEHLPDDPKDILLKYPVYKKLERRIETFDKWPKALKQTPKNLAESGFFYEDIGDEVICFSCGGVLGDWMPEDDEFDEHINQFPECEHIKKTLEEKKSNDKIT